MNEIYDSDDMMENLGRLNFIAFVKKANAIEFDLRRANKR